jgi:hypothetical protein
MAGWIKLHRKVSEWEWYSDNTTFSIFFKLVLQVNTKPKKWKGQTIEVGQMITSYEHLAQKTQTPVRTLKRSMEKLEQSGEIEITNLHRLGIKIEILNYRDYQGQIGTTNGTTNGTTSGIQLKNTKKDKNTLRLTSQR